MARGKYERVVKHRKKQKKVFSILLSIALLLTLAVGGTLAYIVTKSALVENQFQPASVTCSVNDDGTVTNNGNVDAFIRASVVVNWMDNDGNVYGIKPSYTVDINSGWSQIGDFYYYTAAVSPGETTSTAPVTVGVSGDAPSSAYSLSIEVVAEAIQAEGDTDSGNIPAYQDAWGISSIGN